ncbi:MAG: site-specific DNA-methyltransferase, partial [Anaerolineae bacterium]|nr:site-specific DNA-methyltransferase [Anaerolineae bacterium]
AVGLGLPEVDDRYHIWRVSLVNRARDELIGEVAIDAYTSLVVENRSTRFEVLEARLLGRPVEPVSSSRPQERYILSSLRNIVALGDCEEVLAELPAQSVDLVFTSPPYYNARPEYSEFLSYEDYLEKMRRVIRQVHRVLNEGRFFVINAAPVLIRRPNRQGQSRRLAVPMDLHTIFVEEGYDFIDDIIWVKPEGAGWAVGRGRRFAADRTPLQYKPVPVTEYVLVYRKHTDKLIDWNIRSYPDPEAVRQSKITGEYDRTNVWYIQPAVHPEHPAVFPLELAEKVVRYYSFKGDVVLDPFAGVGTTGKAAWKLERRFVLIEKEPRYIDVIRREIVEWMGKAAMEVLYVNCEPRSAAKWW